MYQASPKGESVWSLSGGDEVSDRGRVKQKEDPSGVVTLEIDPVKKVDEGEYACVVKNEMGEARGIVYVVVLGNFYDFDIWLFILHFRYQKVFLNLRNFSHIYKLF